MTMTVHAALLVLALAAGPVRAEVPPPADELSKGYTAALSDLRSGKERQSIAHRLLPLVEKQSASHYMWIVRPFLLELTASANASKAGQEGIPERPLAETGIPFQLLKNSWDSDDRLKIFIAKEPHDPACELAAADRQVITRLIPLLTDSTPARCREDLFPLDWNTPQARVCDVALALIEYHGKVLFHSSSTSEPYLHQLPVVDRNMVAGRVASWWQEVKDESIAAGVRAQLPYGSSYPETVRMAKILARLAGSQNTGDRQLAMNVLQNLVKENSRTFVGAYAADALAELGDTSAVDVFYREWKSSPGLIHDPHILFYLCSHGRRHEWELLHTISVKEISDGESPETGAVWSYVANSESIGINPYAIPILGLVLGQAELPGSRKFEDDAQPFPYAGSACELMQKLVGTDFGYRSNGTAEERHTAIMKARSWWDKEGKQKYSLDFIELKMASNKTLPH